MSTPDQSAKPKSILKPTAASNAASSDQIPGLPPHLQALISQPIRQPDPPSFAAQLIAGTAPPPANAREKRNRELALHHAYLIQRQKEAEEEIFASLMEMLDWPTSPQSTAARPLAAEVSEFQKRIIPFNTSDYDDLLKERAIADKCGYIFCPNPVTKDRSSTRDYKRIFNDGKGGIKVVNRSEVELWCTPACAKRALYIKVQLSETPVWERAGGVGGPIELLKEGDDDLLMQKMEKMSIDDTRSHDERLADAMEELALERGETIDSVVPRLVMNDGISEKDIMRTPIAPSGPIGNPGGVEAYTPRGGRGERDEMEEEDRDWDLS